MGNKASKGGVKAKDLSKYSSLGFSNEEIQALSAQFASFKPGAEGADLPTVSIAEFQAALGFTGKETSLFLERVFKLMDSDKNGSLTFDEFINGIAAFSPNASERKYKFTFAIFDASGKGKISPDDLKVILIAVLKENGVQMTESQVDVMVANTFKQHDTNGDGFMDYEEYKQMCIVNPSILKPLTVNVAEMLKSEGGAAGAGAGK